MKKSKFNYIVLFFLCFFSFYANGNYGIVPKFTLQEGHCRVILNIELGKHAKIYWKNPGRLGFPTNINLSRSTNIKDFNIVWPFPKVEGSTPQDFYYYYSDAVTIPIEINAQDSSKPIALKADLNYAVCDNKCIPVQQTIEQEIKSSCNMTPFRKPSFEVEEILFNKSKSTLKALIKFTEPVTDPNFIIEPIHHIIFPIVKIKKKDNGYFTLEVALPYADLSQLDKAPLTFYSDKSEFPAIYNDGILLAQDKAPSTSLWLMVAFAVLGGFILNFMPCVFPILSLKVLSIIKTLEYKPQKTRTALIISSVGIIVTFLSLGIAVIILKFMGYEVFVGQNFQEPGFITFLCLALVIFISSAQDRINFKLPNLIVNKAGNIKFNNYYLEAFSSGVLASLLSTPCTAPFLGVALSFAFTAENHLIMLIFLSIGLGFSLPYLLLATKPKLLLRLPKPGIWSEKLKKFLSLLLVATLLWLLYIYSTQRGSFSTIGMAGILLLIKFCLESKRGILKHYYIKATLLLALSVSVFYLPAVHYYEQLTLNKQTQDLWKPLDLQAIPTLITSGKTIVVDISANWCVTCKFNKLLVLEQEKTINLLSSDNTIAMRGDFTNYDASILFFLKQNDSSGVPFNIVYGPKAPEGIVLPTLFSYDDLKKAIKQAN